MARLILLHGGAHGSWCWDRVRAPLADAGHQTETVDLLGRAETVDQARTATLDGNVERVCAALEAGPTPAVLVAHSMGGATATMVAERRPDLLARIVFVAALVPVDGEAGLPILQTRAQGSLLLEPGAIIVSEDGLIAEVPAEHAAPAFYSDCEPADVEWACARLCPDPLTPMLTPVSLTAERYGTVPKTFVVTTADRTVPPALQRELAASAGADVVELASGHSPFLGHVDALVAALDRIVS
jgi:pimeloyl-ACP methyl ester carboxylesterase